MTLGRVMEIIEADILCGQDNLHREVESACGADLMSDVLAFAKEKALLLTGLVNPQVIRTAEMMDVKAVLFVRGKTPTKEMIALAEERSLALFSTDKTMYTACGILYSEGLGIQT